MTQADAGEAPCRACTDLSSAFGKTLAQKSGAPKRSASSTTGKPEVKSASTANVAAADPVESAPTAQPLECPPDSVQLGRSSWAFLHTTAAYYPDAPKVEEQESMKQLVRAVSLFYPCGYCAEHLRDYLTRHPPDTKDRRSFSLWMCQMVCCLCFLRAHAPAHSHHLRQHNEVNERLGKPIFDCSRTDERWRYGPRNGSCDS